MKWIQRQWVQALIVFLAALFVYANNIPNDWAYDDIEYITENSYINESGHFGDILTTSYLYGSNGNCTGLYRPLTVLSYALNRQITGLNASSFHLVNDLIHAACSVVALLLLRSLGFGALAFPAALLFALHPIHTEAVSNVVGRAELLSCLFMLSSLAAYYSASLKRNRAYPLALLLFFFALLSKEIPAVLPVIILAGFLTQGLRGEKRRGSRELLEIAGFFAVLGIYLLLRHSAIGHSGVPSAIMMHDNPLSGLAFFERLPTALSVLMKYCLLLLAPFRLSADYSFNQLPLLNSLFSPAALTGLAVAIGLVALWFIALKRSKMLSISVALFGLPLLFVSNIPFTFGTIMGERLLYIPSLGFIMLLVMLFEWLTAGLLRKNAIGIAVLILVSVVYGGRTFARNFDWKDNTSLFAATAISSPNSVKNCYNYALSLRQQGQLRDAVDWYRRAVGIWPEHRNAWFNLGNTLVDMQRPKEALDAFEKADKLVPNDINTLQNLALTYKIMQQPEMAVSTFERILSLRPNDRSVRMNIADVWRSAGDYGRALEILTSIVRDEPNNIGAIVNIGNIHLVEGDSHRAESDYRKALTIAPKNRTPNNALLALLIKGDRMEEAKAEYTRMRKENIPVRRQLAESVSGRF